MCDWDSSSESSENVEGHWAVDPMNKGLWADQNIDALIELWTAFRAHGQALFGDAFLQFCNLDDFIKFVHKHTVRLN